MKLLKRSMIVLVAAALSACASSGGSDTPMPVQPMAVHMGKTSLGMVLTDARGMTLYTFDKDPVGKSVCNGKCAANWPPLMAGADARAMGAYTIVTRDDGSHQWAYEGKPLYGWVKDKKPGDVTGNRFKDVWTVAMAKHG